MASSPPRMALGAVLMGTGNHVAGWRHPHARADGSHDIAFFQHLARTAEAACFDMLFLADSVGIRERGGPETLARSHHIAQLEPLALLSALAVSTERIGLVATASTTYNEPYHVARKFASLDHISHGRAGWNAVTSFTDSEAVNFNREKHLAHDLRYARARAFVDIVCGLWDSWDDDAFVRDKASGIHVDTDKMHYLRHRSEHFGVRGPLNVARPPQGYPVLVQAGASEDGQRLAAETAEVVFCAADTIEQATRLRRDLQQRTAEAGRDPTLLRVMPGVYVVTAPTETEAREKQQALLELVHASIGLAQLSAMIGHDLSSYPVDGPLPEIVGTQGHQSRQRLLVEQARREGLEHPTAVPAGVECLRPQDPGGLGGAGGGRTRALVRGWRGRWLQHHGALPAGRVGGLLPPGRAAAAAQRPAAQPLRGAHTARAPGAAAARQPVRRQRLSVSPPFPNPSPARGEGLCGFRSPGTPRRVPCGTRAIPASTAARRPPPGTAG